MVPFTDPERRREYMRAYMRLRRAGKPRKTLVPLPPASRIETAADVLAILTAAMIEVQAIKGATPDVIMAKAKTLASVSLAVLRALETASLESRIAALESIVNGEGEGIC